MGKFNRWSSQDEYSYTYRIFSKYHEYMNSLYWVHVPASAGAQKNYREAKRNDPNLTTQQAFNLTGNDSFRVTKKLDDYSKFLKEFDNWTRLNTLVSVLSYFEIYLSSIVSLSIESDLGLIYSIPKKIDGVFVIKHNNNSDYSFSDISESITKGEWDKRISSFKNIFGKVPTELELYKKELEKMRKIRNNVAHAFGRDINETRKRNIIDMLPIERLQEKRLQEYMGIIRKVAKSIDKQLFKEHVGEFELIYFYHKEFVNISNSYDLKKKFNSLYIKNRDINFCNDLIDYYSKL